MKVCETAERDMLATKGEFRLLPPTLSSFEKMRLIIDLLLSSDVAIALEDGFNKLCSRVWGTAVSLTFPLPAQTDASWLTAFWLSLV